MRLSPVLCGPLLLAFATMPAQAACGGGGGVGSGGGPIYPSWTPSDQASAKAQQAGSGIVYAIESDKRKVEMWDTALQTLSEKLPFVEQNGEYAKDFARRWNITTLPAVAVADDKGNVLWWSQASVSVAKVTAAIKDAPAEQKLLRQRLDALLAKARKQQAAGQLQQARNALASILHYQGYPAVAEAQRLANDLAAPAPTVAKHETDATQISR
jgi:hypothetical protein